MKEPLTKSVSIQELLHMREEGMSNSQIASSLGVSVVTIRKYIGTSRKYTRHDPSQKKPTSKPKHTNTQIELHDTESVKTCIPSTPVRTIYGMHVINDTRVVELKGRYCTYAVYADVGKVQVLGDGFYFQLDMDQCKHMVRNLGNIFGMLAENERQKLT